MHDIYKCDMDVNKTILPLLLILFVCFTSCDRQGRYADALLSQTETIVEQYPDSALALLDSIRYPRELNEGQYARYALLLVQAKDKAYYDIASDTIIFRARDYFRHKNDPRQAALANFYCARVFQAQHNNNRAMESYLEAESYAAQTSDFNLRGLIEHFIGDLYFEQYLHDKAIVRLKRSQACFAQSPDLCKKEIGSYNAIGNAFLVMQQNDSALHYFNEGLKLAELHHDSAQQALVKHGIGITYRETGDLHSAQKHLSEAIAFCHDSIQQLHSYLSLAGVYNDLNREDSARFYVNQVQSILEQTPQTSSLANFYLLLSQMEEKNGNYKVALEHKHQYTKLLALELDENRKQNVEMIERKYHSELDRNERQRLLNERQWALMAILCLTLMLGAIYFYFYRKHARNEAIQLAREVELAEERILWQEAEQKNVELQELVENAAATENALRNLVLEQSGMFLKANSVARHLSNRREGMSGNEFIRKVNEILYGQEEHDWEKLYQAINEGYNGFFCKLKNQFPQLSDVEYKICCLICTGIDNTEISILLNLSRNTIQQKKTDIRQKLSMPERGDIKSFFEKELDQTLS